MWVNPLGSFLCLFQGWGSESEENMGASFRAWTPVVVLSTISRHAPNIDEHTPEVEGSKVTYCATPVK